MVIWHRPPSILSNIIFLETTVPTEVRFYMEYLCLIGIYNWPRYMTKMAIMPIYVKNPLKSSPVPSQMTVKLGTQKQKRLEPYNIYINVDPGLILICFQTSTQKPLDWFFIEHLCPARTKVYIIDPSHMTKMVTMPIYGKHPLKIFSWNISQMTLKLGTQQKRTWALQKLYDWLQIDLDLFYNKVSSVHLGFYIGKVCPHFQTSSLQKPLYW